MSAHSAPDVLRSFVGPTDLVLEAMFGPRDHDAHVVRRRRWIKLQQDRAWYDAADRRAANALDEILQRYRKPAFRQAAE